MCDEGKDKRMGNLSLEIGKYYPRDLLQRFMPRERSQYEEETNEEKEELELTLGLSLGGRFGVDMNAKKKLTRSSSVVGTVPLLREDSSAATPPPVSNSTLTRTCSLPTETEEEWRKRKELQTLRRMEAKRRRSEKRRNSKEERRETEGRSGLDLREKQLYAVASTVAPPSWWGSVSRQAVLADVLAKGNVGSSGGFQRFGQPCSQGSVDSQGGSSSGMSEMESKPLQGSSSGGEVKSPASNQSLHEQSNQDAAGSSVSKTQETAFGGAGIESVYPPKQPDIAENKGREIGMNAMENMPCVSTKGDGPDGRRIEGILYRYGKGEEVRIMCVCHGSFLSPAEFVKHAGGGDVAHPLKHIVVNPSSTPSL